MQRIKSPANFKIDQIAFIAVDAQDVLDVKRRFGLEDAEWVEDVVRAEGTVRGKPATNLARLLFNYDLGIELEILQYLDGRNYAQHISGGSLCHIGMHWDGTGEKPVFDGLEVVQEVETMSHTNEFLVETGRRYKYTIYNGLGKHGVYLKIIERLEMFA